MDNHIMKIDPSLIDPKKTLLIAVENYGDDAVVYVPSETLRSVGAKIDQQIPDGRPVPVLVQQIKKICSAKKTETKKDDRKDD